MIQAAAASRITAKRQAVSPSTEGTPQATSTEEGPTVDICISTSMTSLIRKGGEAFLGLIERKERNSGDTHVCALESVEQWSSAATQKDARSNA